jgi:hypothetical protein
MKPANRSYRFTDVADAPYTRDIMESFALFRIPGNKDNLINHPLERIHQPLDKCPAVVREKIFFLPVSTPCLAANQYHR